jgi:hypothetical protein
MKLKSKSLFLFLIVFLLLSQFAVLQFGFVPIVKAQESSGSFGNPSLPDWKNISVVVAGDGKSFTLDNADNLTSLLDRQRPGIERNDRQAGSRQFPGAPRTLRG